MKTIVKDKRKIATVLSMAIIVVVAVVMLALVSCSEPSRASGPDVDQAGIEVTDGDSTEVEEGFSNGISNGVSDDAFAVLDDAKDNADTISSESQTPIQNSTQENASAAGSPSPARTEVASSHAPEKRWVEDTEPVWVIDVEAWSEKEPIYGYKEVSICNICGTDITGNTTAHGKAHMLEGEGSGHHSDVQQIITGYNTINHEAKGHYETKVVGGHWE